MKKLLTVGTLFLAIIMIGCSKKSDDPKGVLGNFFESLGKKDFTNAKKYATESSKSFLDLMEMGSKADKDDKSLEAFSKENMEIGEPKIEGDKASVPVKDKKKGETVTFILKKEKNEWKVAFDKESMMEMGKESMKDNPMPDLNDMPAIESESGTDAPAVDTPMP